ncbi:MAG: TonB-dependent receptor [Bryobacterales bacterium]|nr:TonB-dependent receptor [Bryobacterales bacterium]
MRILLTGILIQAWLLAAEDQPPSGQATESVLFDTPPQVETASLYTQTIDEAPASVTVVTRQEIRRFGYRTLAEVLSNVRGFYTTSDGPLHYAGVRGFGLPGDYNTRILVMVNGHYMTDNVYTAMYLFGQDFGIDMDLVQRIEIVRGPSSALYGSNGMFATVNIFTISPADAPRGYASSEFGSFGEKKMLVSGSFYLGRGANLLLSASGFHTRGRTISAAELGGLETRFAGAEQGYHTFAPLTFRYWSVTANFADRRAIVPTGWYRTDFGDTGTSVRDNRNFIEAAYTRPLGEAAELQWRTYYDQYRYYGRYDTTYDEAVWDERDFALGDWLGTRLVYQRKLRGIGNFTIGSQAEMDLRNLQVSEYARPIQERYRETAARTISHGLFAQQVWDLTRTWSLTAGVRLDDTNRYRSFVSPRLAAVWKASARTSYKFLVGRAFRNPSTYERLWYPNPALEAERINTYEIAREQRIGSRAAMTATVFHYGLQGLIHGVPVEAGLLQYRNVSEGCSWGSELEISGKASEWLQLATSASLHRPKYGRPEAELPNSPMAVGQFRAFTPLFRERLVLSAAARYLSSRGSPYDFRVGPVALLDVTATTKGLHRDFDLQFGVRNASGRRYADPLSTEHLLRTMPRPGRSVFLKLIWRYGE